MFKKKKDSINFETDNYKMSDNYDTNNLVVANLEYVTNDDIPMVKTTEQRYLFEIINDIDGKKYREIFTGFLATKESEYFNMPYVVNIVPLNKIMNIIDNVSKYALLLVLNEINDKKKNNVCVIFKDKEEEKKFSDIASNINHRNDQNIKKKKLSR